MSAGRRTDLLTDALLHYGTRQLRNFGSSLQAKLKRCSSMITHTLLQIQELFSKLSVAYDPLIINKWMEEERKCIQERKCKKMRPLTWKEQYVEGLLHLYQLRAQIANIAEGDHSQLTDVVKKSKKVLKAVQRIERQQKLKKRWKTGERKFNAAAISLEQRRQESVMESTYSSAYERMFLISLKNKYADGQAIAIKLSKQITQRTNAIKAAVTKYNSSLNSLEDWVQELPEQIQFHQAKDPHSTMYSHLNNQPSSDTVPFAAIRAAVDLHNFLERCKEEQVMLLLEVERLFRYYVERKEDIGSYCTAHSGDKPKLVTGVIAMAKQEIVEINNMLFLLSSKLSEHLNVENIKSQICTRKIEAQHSFDILDIEMGLVTISSLEDEMDEEESPLLNFSDDDSDSSNDNME